MRHKHKAIERPCRVYWGSHGCRKQRGHLGNHLCSPGCPIPIAHAHMFGEDYQTDNSEQVIELY